MRLLQWAAQARVAAVGVIAAVGVLASVAFAATPPPLNKLKGSVTARRLVDRGAVHDRRGRALQPGRCKERPRHGGHLGHGRRLRAVLQG